MSTRFRFLANNIWKVYHTFLFRKQESCNENHNCQFVAVISMKYFRTFPHVYEASFSLKTYFYWLETFLISSTRHIFRKLLCQLRCFQNRHLWYTFQTLFAWKRGLAHLLFIWKWITWVLSFEWYRKNVNVLGH